MAARHLSRIVGMDESPFPQDVRFRFVRESRGGCEPTRETPQVRQQ